jgi:hypothetical protein
MPLKDMTPDELVELRQQIAAEFERRNVCDHGLSLGDMCPHCMANPSHGALVRPRGLGGVVIQDDGDSEDEEMPMSAATGLVEYKGNFVMVSPILNIEDGNPKSGGSFCCFVLDEKDKRKRQLIAVSEKDGTPSRFKSLQDALDGAAEYADLWFRGIV